MGKRFVYVLRSDAYTDRHYVGIASNPDERLEWYNHGPCGYTRANRPWSIVVSIELPTEQQAVKFEKYLKTGSGRVFAKRHFAALAASRTSSSVKTAKTNGCDSRKCARSRSVR